jgi:predicted DNA-binding ribbon-helix-helix protein
MKIPYWFEEENEDDVWFDYKCKNVVFPSHEGNINGEVRTYRIEQAFNKAIKKNGEALKSLD